MRVIEPTARFADLRRTDNVFLRGRNQIAVEFPPETDENALLWIEKKFKQLPADLSIQTAEAEHALFPASPAEAVKALKLLKNEENSISELIDEFIQIKSDINELIGSLYEARKS